MANDLSSPNIEIFPWTKHLETGVIEIDSQHKKLVALLNSLVNGLINESKQEDVDHIFISLKQYANEHFKLEETMFMPYFTDDHLGVEHVENHRFFVRKIEELYEDSKSQNQHENLISFLIQWLVAHILESDLQMVKYIQLIKAGSTKEDAQEKAMRFGAASHQVLLQAILGMYNRLAMSIIQLTKEMKERKQMELALQCASKKAIAATQAKSNFLASMSHEIRTPINGILGMSTLLLKTDLTADQRENVQIIQKSTESLISIINDILDFSKVEAGKIQIENIEFDLRELIQDTIQTVKYLADQKGLKIHLEGFSEGVFAYMGDPNRIRQIVLNILGNAIKFTPSGNIWVRCHITNGNSSLSTICLEIEDQGIGIPEDKLHEIFDAFTQSDISIQRHYGGTGLGLAISQRLVALMGGSIHVTSEEGRGSKFWIEIKLSKCVFSKEKNLHLPLAVAQKSAAGLNLLNEDKEKHFAGQQFHILVVEDNEINRVVIAKQLNNLNHIAEIVSNGSEVLKILENKKFDLILMDCQMPILDGYETTAAIRRSKQTEIQSIPVVALTACVFSEEKERCLKVGMNDVLYKPISLNQLEDVIVKWGNRKQRYN